MTSWQAKADQLEAYYRYRRSRHLSTKVVWKKLCLARAKALKEGRA